MKTTRYVYIQLQNNTQIWWHIQACDKLSFHDSEIMDHIEISATSTLEAMKKKLHRLCCEYKSKLSQKTTIQLKCSTLQCILCRLCLLLTHYQVTQESLCKYQ